MQLCLIVVVLASMTAGTTGQLTPSPAWSPHSGNITAPARCIIQMDDWLIGARGEATLNLWGSKDNGMTWVLLRENIISDQKPEEFADVTTWYGTLGGQPALIIAYREQWVTNSQYHNFSVSMIASFDKGQTWSDRVLLVPPTPPHFVGAPFIYQISNGSLLVFYDSEVLPAKAGIQPGHQQWIGFMSGNYTNGQFVFSGQMVASRYPQSSGQYSRDGMATVTRVDETTLLLVCEGVGLNQYGVQHDIVLSQVLRDNGDRIDFVGDRGMVYSPGVVTGGNRSFNAYCPYSTITPLGEKLVVFSTDEDASAPTPPGFPPYSINSTVKYVTLHNGVWGPRKTLYASEEKTYLAGVMTTGNATMVSTIRLRGGEEVVFTNHGGYREKWYAGYHRNQSVYHHDRTQFPF
eukprot:TRINITY_DN24205_c0_g1_i1.p1 TRINITY_DN24205_c0_g1~~TRINITY_DN24205_c0_g1_i1.p1  ORF type:complete len:422 (+),score=80.31 TRINITY_DN24205_c0_g1_i1:54-1268(+)